MLNFLSCKFYCTKTTKLLKTTNVDNIYGTQTVITKGKRLKLQDKDFLDGMIYNVRKNMSKRNPIKFIKFIRIHYKHTKERRDPILEKLLTKRKHKTCRSSTVSRTLRHPRVLYTQLILLNSLIR